MFERLSESLNTAFRNLSGRGRITEGNVREAMADVRTALLEADVNLEVVDRFCEDCVQDALGATVTQSLQPGQEMVGIVHKRLVSLMGPVDSHITLVEPGPTIVMMCGLQGSGKTTTCGKLAAWFKKRGQSVMVAAADLQRPAAVEQLQTVIEGVATGATGPGRVAFYGEPDKCAEYGKAVGVAVGVCQRALAAAKQGKFDVLILDTAGRLHVNDELMKALEQVDRVMQPHNILLDADGTCLVTDFGACVSCGKAGIAQTGPSAPMCLSCRCVAWQGKCVLARSHTVYSHESTARMRIVQAVLLAAPWLMISALSYLLDFP